MLFAFDKNDKEEVIFPSSTEEDFQCNIKT